MRSNIPTKIDLMRDPQKAFPQIEYPSVIRAARIWHCKYRSLAPLADLVNLEALVIANVPDSSLDFLRPLKKLRYLWILHMPKVTDIDPLADLDSLEVLAMATSPGWDAAAKRTVVQTLDPIARLPSLKHIELFGVVPADSSLAGLQSLSTLVSARFSGYPQAETRRFLERGITQESVPASSFFESDDVQV